MSIHLKVGSAFSQSMSCIRILISPVSHSISAWFVNLLSVCLNNTTLKSSMTVLVHSLYAGEDYYVQWTNSLFPWHMSFLSLYTLSLNEPRTCLFFNFLLFWVLLFWCYISIDILCGFVNDITCIFIFDLGRDSWRLYNIIVYI